jgi:hypothetical protein
MSTSTRHVRLFRNGRNQALRIPREFELEGEEALIHNMEIVKKRLASDTAPKKPTLFNDTLENPVYASALANIHLDAANDNLHLLLTLAASGRKDDLVATPNVWKRTAVMRVTLFKVCKRCQRADHNQCKKKRSQ